MSKNDSLPMYVIYWNPSDYPRQFVVRRFDIHNDGTATVERSPRAVVNSLATARENVPPGLVCINRETADDPVIIETWF